MRQSQRHSQLLHFPLYRRWIALLIAFVKVIKTSGFRLLTNWVAPLVDLTRKLAIHAVDNRMPGDR